MVTTPTITRMMVAQFFLLLMAIAPFALALDKTWTLQHSLNRGQDFSHRASVLLSVDPESDNVAISITNDNSTLTKEAYLAAKAPGAMYQLKLFEEGGGSKDKNSFVLSSVPGCQLLQSNFRYAFLQQCTVSAENYFVFFFAFTILFVWTSLQYAGWYPLEIPSMFYLITTLCTQTTVSVHYIQLFQTSANLFKK